MRVLQLARRIRPGTAIGTTVTELARRWGEEGTAAVGCLEADDRPPDLPVRAVRPTSGAVAELARRVDARVVVAHEPPFHRLLDGLPAGVARVAWHHRLPADDRSDGAGSPLPETAPPADVRTVVSSRFLRSELGLRDAAVVPPATDHLEGREAGPRAARPRAGRPFRVGTEIRSRSGGRPEAAGRLFAELARSLRASMEEVEARALAPAEEAEPLRATGVAVRACSEEAKRADFLRGTDLFVGTDLGTGAGLDVLEAQAVGTAAVAFDAGAYPEACPLVAGRPADVVELARACRRDPELLARHAGHGRSFARERGGWDRVAGRVADLARGSRRGAEAGGQSVLRTRAGGAADRIGGTRRRVAERWARTVRRVRTEGAGAALGRALRRWLSGGR